MKKCEIYFFFFKQKTAYEMDAQGEMAQKYGVMSIPTYVIEKDGKEVARTTGARPKEEFKRWVEEQL